MPGYHSMLEVRSYRIETIVITYIRLSVAPTKDLMCAFYIAPGINALPQNDEYKDYSDEYENTDDDHLSKENGNLLRKDISRPVC